MDSLARQNWRAGRFLYRPPKRKTRPQNTTSKMKDVLITLSKHYKTHSIGTLQVFDGEKELQQVYCLALPFLNNARNVSRIPDGTYQATVLNSSDSFKYRHIYIDVPEPRTYIKIHRANSYKELTGCFAVGTGLWDEGVENSKFALDAVLRAIGDDKFQVIIKTV